MTDPVGIGLIAAFTFFIGWFFGEAINARRKSRKDTLCPTCFAPTDADGFCDREKLR